MAEEVSHYEILQVSQNACVEVIQAAYRALQRQFHPDAGGTGELSEALNKARDILLDPLERNRYDATLKIGGVRAKAPRQAATDDANGAERTYVICPKCRTRTMVDYHALDDARCFGCDNYLLPREAQPPRVEDQKVEQAPTPQGTGSGAMVIRTIGLMVPAWIAYRLVLAVHGHLGPTVAILAVAAWLSWLVLAATKN